MKDLHGDNMRMRSGAGADPAGPAARDEAERGDRPVRPRPNRADGEAERDRFPVD